MKVVRAFAQADSSARASILAVFAPLLLSLSPGAAIAEKEKLETKLLCPFHSGEIPLNDPKECLDRAKPLRNRGLALCKAVANQAENVAYGIKQLEDAQAKFLDVPVRAKASPKDYLAAAERAEKENDLAHKGQIQIVARIAARNRELLGQVRELGKAYKLAMPQLCFEAKLFSDELDKSQGVLGKLEKRLDLDNVKYATNRQGAYRAQALLDANKDDLGDLAKMNPADRAKVVEARRKAGLQVDETTGTQSSQFDRDLAAGQEARAMLADKNLSLPPEQRKELEKVATRAEELAKAALESDRTSAKEEKLKSAGKVSDGVKQLEDFLGSGDGSQLALEEPGHYDKLQKDAATAKRFVEEVQKSEGPEAEARRKAADELRMANPKAPYPSAIALEMERLDPELKKRFDEKLASLGPDATPTQKQQAFLDFMTEEGPRIVNIQRDALAKATNLPPEEVREKLNAYVREYNAIVDKVKSQTFTAEDTQTQMREALRRAGWDDLIARMRADPLAAVYMMNGDPMGMMRSEPKFGIDVSKNHTSGVYVVGGLGRIDELSAAEAEAAIGNVRKYYDEKQAWSANLGKITPPSIVGTALLTPSRMHEAIYGDDYVAAERGRRVEQVCMAFLNACAAAALNPATTGVVNTALTGIQAKVEDLQRREHIAEQGGKFGAVSGFLLPGAGKGGGKVVGWLLGSERVATAGAWGGKAGGALGFLTASGSDMLNLTLGPDFWMAEANATDAIKLNRNFSAQLLNHKSEMDQGTVGVYLATSVFAGRFGALGDVEHALDTVRGFSARNLNHAPTVMNVPATAAWSPTVGGPAWDVSLRIPDAPPATAIGQIDAANSFPASANQGPLPAAPSSTIFSGPDARFAPPRPAPENPGIEISAGNPGKADLGTPIEAPHPHGGAPVDSAPSIPAPLATPAPPPASLAGRVETSAPLPPRAETAPPSAALPPANPEGTSVSTWLDNARATVAEWKAKLDDVFVRADANRVAPRVDDPSLGPVAASPPPAPGFANPEARYVPLRPAIENPPLEPVAAGPGRTDLGSRADTTYPRGGQPVESAPSIPAPLPSLAGRADDSAPASTRVETSPAPAVPAGQDAGFALGRAPAATDSRVPPSADPRVSAPTESREPVIAAKSPFADFASIPPAETTKGTRSAPAPSPAPPSAAPSAPPAAIPSPLAATPSPLAAVPPPGTTVSPPSVAIPPGRFADAPPPPAAAPASAGRVEPPPSSALPPATALAAADANVRRLNAASERVASAEADLKRAVDAQSASRSGGRPRKSVAAADSRVTAAAAELAGARRQLGETRQAVEIPAPPPLAAAVARSNANAIDNARSGAVPVNRSQASAGILENRTHASAPIPVVAAQSDPSGWTRAAERLTRMEDAGRLRRGVPIHRLSSDEYADALRDVYYAEAGATRSTSGGNASTGRNFPDVRRASATDTAPSHAQPLPAAFMERMEDRVRRETATARMPADGSAIELAVSRKLEGIPGVRAGGADATVPAANGSIWTTMDKAFERINGVFGAPPPKAGAPSVFEALESSQSRIATAFDRPRSLETGNSGAKATETERARYSPDYQASEVLANFRPHPPSKNPMDGEPIQNLGTYTDQAGISFEVVRVKDPKKYGAEANFEGNPLAMRQILGDEAARALGYHQLADDLFLLPNATTLNRGLDRLEAMGFQPSLRYVDPPASGTGVGTWDYIQFVRDGKVPVGPGPKEKLHDATVHGPAFLLPARSVADARSEADLLWNLREWGLKQTQGAAQKEFLAQVDALAGRHVTETDLFVGGVDILLKTKGDGPAAMSAVKNLRGGWVPGNQESFRKQFDKFLAEASGEQRGFWTSSSGMTGSQVRQGTLANIEAVRRALSEPPIGAVPAPIKFTARDVEWDKNGWVVPDPKKVPRIDPKDITEVQRFPDEQIVASNSGFVYSGWLNGENVILKPASIRNDAFREGILYRVVNGEGLGVRFHGITEVNGDLAVVMSRADGDAVIKCVDGNCKLFAPKGKSHSGYLVGEHTYRQIAEAEATLVKAGLDPWDLQFIVNAKGNATLIDLVHYKPNNLPKKFGASLRMPDISAAPHFYRANGTLKSNSERLVEGLRKQFPAGEHYSAKLAAAAPSVGIAGALERYGERILGFLDRSYSKVFGNQVERAAIRRGFTGKPVEHGEYGDGLLLTGHKSKNDPVGKVATVVEKKFSAWRPDKTYGPVQTYVFAKLPNAGQVPHHSQPQMLLLHRNAIRDDGHEVVAHEAAHVHSNVSDTPLSRARRIEFSSGESVFRSITSSFDADSYSKQFRLEVTWAHTISASVAIKKAEAALKAGDLSEARRLAYVARVYGSRVRDLSASAEHLLGQIEENIRLGMYWNSAHGGVWTSLMVKPDQANWFNGKSPWSADPKNVLPTRIHVTLPVPDRYRAYPALATSTALELIELGKADARRFVRSMDKFQARLENVESGADAIMRERPLGRIVSFIRDFGRQMDNAYARILGKTDDQNAATRDLAAGRAEREGAGAPEFSAKIPESPDLDSGLGRRLASVARDPAIAPRLEVLENALGEEGVGELLRIFDGAGPASRARFLEKLDSANEAELARMRERLQDPNGCAVKR